MPFKTVSVLFSKKVAFNYLQGSALLRLLSAFPTSFKLPKGNLLINKVSLSLCIYIYFLDLEKVFDRPPHKLIWYALQHLVADQLVS